MGDDVRTFSSEELSSNPPLPSLDASVLSSAHATWSEDASLSPSLRPGREEPAYEMKFLLDRDKAAAIFQWAKEKLTLDPHGDPRFDHAYRVHSLYLDTADFDVLKKSPRYKRKKYRLRRYGDEPTVFLEQKRKVGSRVTKRRTKIEETEMQRLLDPSPLADWVGEWFHRRLHDRKLRPSCQISYERFAFFGESLDGPLRLTMDRNLHAARAEDWQVPTTLGGMSLLNDEMLLELKYQSHVPALFKNMLHDFGVMAKPMSKYRLAAAKCGFEPTGTTHG